MKKVISLVISMLILFSAVTAFATSTPSAWALVEVRAAIGEGIVPESIQDNYQSAITRSDFCDMIMAVYAKLDDYEKLVTLKDLLEKYIKDLEAMGKLRNITVQFDFD